MSSPEAPDAVRHLYKDYRSESPHECSRSMLQRKSKPFGSFDVINRSLTNISMAKPVYALVGADSYLQVQELGKILTDLPADSQRIDYDGETAELAEVLDDLRSFAMFGGGKIVSIR